MFIGREDELHLLEELYASGKFEYLVLYGRRRVGKTALLTEFSRRHDAIFLSAQQKNDSLNLTDFSRAAQTCLEGKMYGRFPDWESAFDYIADKAGQKRVVLIIDEFPYLAEENPSVKSILQHTIDHRFRDSGLFLILCGSSVSFMEKEVMGAKSPLYGRSTAQMELKPFDYLESAAFFPGYSAEEKLTAYGILGGIPCYLQSFDDSVPLERNISRNILRTGAFLKDEPQNLLKMELREPAIYNSIFEMIAAGTNHLNDIAQKIHEEPTKCSKYMSTLQTMKLLSRMTPCGADRGSRKTLYKIADNFFVFWYRYIAANRSYYELAGPETAAAEITEDLPNFMGDRFEEICREYMIRLAKKHRLPFIPREIGRWWGGNPKTKKEDDIDILALNRSGDAAIFCECKFRNRPFDISEYSDLLTAAESFPDVNERYYYLFSKSGFTDAVQNFADDEHVRLFTLEDLFAI